jgi:hypothetical protein
MTRPVTEQDITSLDMELIKQKLVAEKGWTPDMADQVEKVYKGFLVLSVKYPGFRLHDDISPFPAAPATRRKP